VTDVMLPMNPRKAIRGVFKNALATAQSAGQRAERRLRENAAPTDARMAISRHSVSPEAPTRAVRALFAERIEGGGTARHARATTA
jgi:hypothetical protein